MIDFQWESVLILERIQTVITAHVSGVMEVPDSQTGI